jgi:hypothetical protein
VNFEIYYNQCYHSAFFFAQLHTNGLVNMLQFIGALYSFVSIVGNYVNPFEKVLVKTFTCEFL